MSRERCVFKERCLKSNKRSDENIQCWPSASPWWLPQELCLWNARAGTLIEEWRGQAKGGWSWQLQITLFWSLVIRRSREMRRRRTNELKADLCLWFVVLIGFICKTDERASCSGFGLRRLYLLHLSKQEYGEFSTCLCFPHSTFHRLLQAHLTPVAWIYPLLSSLLPWISLTYLDNALLQSYSPLNPLYCKEIRLQKALDSG